MNFETEIDLGQGEQVVQLVIKDCLCVLCLLKANTVMGRSPLCKECFQWIGLDKADGGITKGGWRRTMSDRLQYLEYLRKGLPIPDMLKLQGEE